MYWLSSGRNRWSMRSRAQDGVGDWTEFAWTYWLCSIATTSGLRRRAASCASVSLAAKPLSACRYTVCAAMPVAMPVATALAPGRSVTMYSPVTTGPVAGATATSGGGAALAGTSLAGIAATDSATVSGAAAIRTVSDFLIRRPFVTRAFQTVTRTLETSTPARQLDDW